jgi:hypothetical protein
MEQLMLMIMIIASIHLLFLVNLFKLIAFVYLKETKEHEIIIYEFHFPIDLCGRLIGRQGVHVDYIRQMTQVDLVVRDDAVSYEKQVVALHGRRVDVEKAIELIAKRFPSERYPQVAFKPINKKIILRQRAPECIPIPSSVAQVKMFT